jgi:hypothetical protein
VTRDGRFYAIFGTVCLGPAVAYAIRAWFGYAATKDALLKSYGQACLGDAACLAALKQEAWLDFVIGATIGGLMVFIATFAIVVAFIVVIDQLRFRYRGSSQAGVGSKP